MTPFFRNLPYGQQWLDEEDEQAVLNALRSRFLTTGPLVPQFESEIGAAVGAEHVSVCSNGTAALHLALLGLGIGPGDTVIVPSICFVGAANAVELVGADVVFCDVDGNSALATAETVEATLHHLDRPPKAVILIHMAGQLADVAGIRAILPPETLIVEDAAHALGASYSAGQGRSGSPVGSCPDSACTTFSFHPVKTVTSGEGGAICTNDPELNKRIKQLRTHGMVKDPDLFTETDQAFDKEGTANPWYYEIHQAGLNYRLSDIHCALGISQLKKLQEFCRKRSELQDMYQSKLAAFSPLVKTLSLADTGSPAWHLQVLLIDFEKAGVTRRDVMERLGDVGIGTQVHFIPSHLQPRYKACSDHQNFDGAISYYSRALSVPLFPAMAELDVDYVVNHLDRILKIT